MAAFMYRPNQDLENLRQLDEPPDVLEKLNDWTIQIKDTKLEKITKYPAGLDVLNTICVYIDGTPMESKGNWEEFTSELGFDIHFIQKVKNFASIKGVTLDILSEYALQKNGTLKDVLQVLKALKRFDILLQISDSMNELLNIHHSDTVRQQGSPGQCDSGIFSSELIRVVGEPDLGNLENVPTLKKESSNPEKRSPGKVVLLTFVDDGKDLAMDIVCAFQKTTPRVGVLILERNQEYLEVCSTAIHRWFNEVDYIIPIITPQYLWHIAPRKEMMVSSENSSIDARYARLIYIMMNEEFMRNACLNHRVRPVLSARASRECGSHPFLSNPLFFSCRQEEEIETMAKTLAAAPVRR